MDVDGIRLGMTNRQARKGLRRHRSCQQEPPVTSSSDFFLCTCIMFRDQRVAWVHGHALHVDAGRVQKSVHEGATQADVLNALGPADTSDESTWEYHPNSPGQPKVQIDVEKGRVESFSLH